MFSCQCRLQNSGGLPFVIQQPPDRGRDHLEADDCRGAEDCCARPCPECGPGLPWQVRPCQPTLVFLTCSMLICTCMRDSHLCHGVCEPWSQPCCHQHVPSCFKWPSGACLQHPAADHHSLRAAQPAEAPVILAAFVTAQQNKFPIGIRPFQCCCAGHHSQQPGCLILCQKCSMHACQELCRQACISFDALMGKVIKLNQSLRVYGCQGRAGHSSSLMSLRHLPVGPLSVCLSCRR